jgi:hypothetical protein
MAIHIQDKKSLEEKLAAQEKAAADIDFSDPEVAAAATRIQASFKGYLTRQELEKNKQVWYTGIFHWSSDNINNYLLMVYSYF